MKVGIITHYCRSCNYGGNLQAYALCRVIQKMGYPAEQISLNVLKSRNFKKKLKSLVKKTLMWRRVCFSWNLKKRSKSFLAFNQGAIPHSPEYIDKTIGKCTDRYDIFITGSDQVWHPLACRDAYLLTFVPEGKKKLSYAASVATNELSGAQRERYRKAFASFDAISVREHEAAELLQELYPKQIVCTLDPTLLLDRKEWESVLEPYPISSKYVFSFFLGPDQTERKLAEEFARKRHLKLVTIPHLQGRFWKCDADFGDEQLYDVTPPMLLGLIQNAEYVFTDSFHVTVFSLIFQKEHFVFHRSDSKAMESRIVDLTEMFGTEEHFCSTKERQTLAYLEQLKPIDYTREPVQYQRAKESSLLFLKEALAEGNTDA